MTAPDIIKQLVERFDLHREAYQAGKYNEAQLRREFLDPFFDALGWDVFNRLGYSEENKHVIHEDSLDIEGMKKAPDYAFKIGKERKFFVEAKKPFVKIETNAEVAFQLKRYVLSLPPRAEEKPYERDNRSLSARTRCCYYTGQVASRWQNQ
jgi:hypothetical protein